MPEKPFFLITIDTEGDDVWSKPANVGTRNSLFLPRFQELCEQFGFRPTYLVNYEMAMCSDFQRFGREILRRDAAEIGMHLHAWNAPPLKPIAPDEYQYLPFLTDYPPEVMREKVEFQTKLLKDVFEVVPVSHRAGRWGFDERYSRILSECGYQVDCSVTPGVSWKKKQQNAPGWNGPDYRNSPDQPYWICLEGSNGESSLLELPVTLYRSANWSWARPEVLRRALNRVQPEFEWLRPTGRNLRSMLNVLSRVISENRSYAQFMLHSSELMPGGSPMFRTPNSIERLYADLKSLFAAAARSFSGSTLSQYRSWYCSTASHTKLLS